jgi:hypothetical protein
MRAQRSKKMGKSKVPKSTKIHKPGHQGAARRVAKCAALKFEPLTPEEIKDCPVSTNDEWLKHLVLLRVAWLTMGRSKDNLKEVIQAAPEIFDDFAFTIEILNASVELLQSAEMRLLSAGAAMALDGLAVQHS